MPEADKQVEGTVIICGSGSIYAHSSFLIDKNGLLQRNQNETSHQRSWSHPKRTARKAWTKSDADLWLNGRIVIEIGKHHFWGIPTRLLSGFRQGQRLNRKEEKLLLSSSFLRYHATDSKARLQELINARNEAIRQALDKMRQASSVA
jgi:hypothetical protein